MAYRAGKVGAPVRTQDVATALGVSETRVGKLCTNYDKIKKWAKFKPVKHTKLTALTVDDRRSVHYGITNIPLYNYQAPMAMRMAGRGDSTFDPVNGYASEYWKYETPGVNDPKRLGDFDQYNHTIATPPISPMDADELDLQQGTGSTINFDFPVNDPDDVNMNLAIRLNDFDFGLVAKRLSEPTATVSNAPYYLGVCITDGIGTGNDCPGTRLFTQSTPIVGANASFTTVTSGGKKCVRVSIPYADFVASAPPKGESIMVFPFVADSSFGIMSPNGTKRNLIPLTMAAKYYKVKTSNQFSVAFTDISGSITSAANKTCSITVKVKIINNHTGEMSFTGTLTLFKEGGSEIQEKALRAGTIQPGTPYEGTFTFTGISYAGDTSPGNYYVVLTATPADKVNYEIRSEMVRPL